MYDTSNYKKLFDKNLECTRQYCSKERADRAKQYDVPIPKKEEKHWLKIIKEMNNNK